VLVRQKGVLIKFKPP